MKKKTLILCCLSFLVFAINLNAFEGVTNMNLKIKITVANKIVIANLENNVATQELIKRLPLKLKMLDLYDRELVYRFSNPLPTSSLRSDAYSVGDIIYWPPRHSFVILYQQNGEKFSRQQLGHIDADLSFLNQIGDIDVTFELYE